MDVIACNRRFVRAACVAASAALALACAAQPRAEATLAARVRSSDPGPDYTFTYEALGSSILDCTSPNRRFTGRADRQGVVIFDDRSRPIVVTTPSRMLLHRRLFAPMTTRVGWVEVDGDDQVTELIGPDLAGYVGANQPPATPWETIDAAIDASDRVHARASAQDEAVTYWVELDGTVGEEQVDQVRLVAQFDGERRLASLTVAQSATDGAEQVAVGWRLTLGVDGVPPRPGQGRAVQFEDLVPPVRPALPTSSCELGGS